MTRAVLYRATASDYQPPESHRSLGDNEYVAPDENGLDALETADQIDVLDWNYETDSARDISLDGPPEPVITTDEDGDAAIRIAIPPTEPRDPVQFIPLGTWLCERCGNKEEFGVADGELIDPYHCSSCERQGPFNHAGDLTTDQVQAALRADTMWHTSSGLSDTGYGDLWDDLNQFLRDHWDASEPEVYHGLTAYTLTTWVRENLTFVPHLMLMGKTTGGKTRLLNTLARVSYRAIVTSSATPASMFRLIDAYDISYYISEYHGLNSESRRELDNVIRAGQKRGEVITRAEPSSQGYEPLAFDPFSHVAVATQFTPADDIVNRCIQVRSSPANRDMPATLDDDRAETLRNRLLYARYRLLDSLEWQHAEEAAYEYLADRNITGRTREKLLSLLTVAHLWDRVNALAPFVDVVVQQDREAAADSQDALVVEAIRDLAFDAIASNPVLGDADPFAQAEIPLSDIADRYESMTGTEKSPAWVGHVRSRLDLEKARKSDGTVISDPDLRPKLRELCEDHNLTWERLESHATVEELDEEERYKGDCSECGRGPRWITHRDIEERGLICDDCATELEEVT